MLGNPYPASSVEGADESERDGEGERDRGQENGRRRTRRASLKCREHIALWL